ncbi:hypothetical protein ACFWWN_11950 [Streptomyces sp. NPDC059082]|uniref:hypothetical protein n=1 Tax=Streptomyces sp. NPDC059082 TaxID=3346720 RepID=UPI00367E1466
MRFYAQTPARRNLQVFVDLSAVALIAVVVWAAFAVRRSILLLAEPGRRVESAGDSLAEGLGNAGDAASGVPLIGDILKKPLQAAAGAGSGFADAGVSLQETVSQAADVITTVFILIPVLFVLLLWLPPRLLWIRRSSALRRLAESPGGADLLALRALTGPPGALAELPAPPGGWADAWRQGDRQAITALSAIALHRIGLRP